MNWREGKNECGKRYLINFSSTTTRMGKKNQRRKKRHATSQSTFVIRVYIYTWTGRISFPVWIKSITTYTASEHGKFSALQWPQQQPRERNHCLSSSSSLIFLLEQDFTTVTIPPTPSRRIIVVSMRPPPQYVLTKLLRPHLRHVSE